jgi:hypothetical protein
MKNTIYISVIIVLLYGSGCSKLEDFGDTNVNPLTTNVPATGALLTASLVDIGWAEIIGGYYCQYFSATFQPELSCYSSNQSSSMEVYYGVLYDLQNIINTNTNDATKANAEHWGANANQIAIARILKAYIYWGITDSWGDIPYNDALKGKPDVAYDQQETIYKDLIKELTEAVAQFTTGIPVQGDIIYNGDTEKWTKLANSLRMLLSINLSKRYPGVSEYAAVQFRTALEDPAGSIELNEDNFQLNYPGNSTFRNPFYDVFIGGNTAESETIVSILNDYIGSDQRKIVFGSDRQGNPSDIGVPYGRDRTFVDPWCQQNPEYCVIMSPDFRSENSPLFLIKASTVLLARAEAADLGWTSENTNGLYVEGITASFAGWDLPAPEDDYFAKPNVALGPAGTNLKQIAIQEYLAAYPDGHLGWNLWRRTGYPELIPAPDALNYPKVIPRRIMYGTSDYALTVEGVEEAVARLGPNGDKMDSRMWWDKE